MTTRQSFHSPTVLSGPALPPALQDLTSPPAVAYLWGQVPPGPRIGLVGTRKPSAAGFRIAFQTARRLSALGMTIVSGGAWGIDRAAHLGALRSGRPTLVVGPVWPTRAYPAENLPLFEAVVARGGGYVTVATEETPPFRPAFHRRNEILTALCDIVLLGEMGVPSGTLSAARFAREQSRPRLLLPWLLDAPDTRGVQAELDRGAGGYFRPSQIVRLLEGRRFDNPLYWQRAAEVLAELAATEAAERRKRSRRSKDGAGAAGPSNVAAPLTPSAPREGDAVLQAIVSGASTIDAVVATTGLEPAVVQHRVLLLTLEGAVRRDGAGLLRAT